MWCHIAPMAAWMFFILTYTSIGFLHLWKILLIKSQKSKQCRCKSVHNGCTGPCNNWFLKIIFLSSHTIRLSVVAFLKIRSDFTEMCKPASIQHPTCAFTLTSPWQCGECHVCKKCNLEEGEGSYIELIQSLCASTSLHTAAAVWTRRLLNTVTIISCSVTFSFWVGLLAVKLT